MNKQEIFTKVATHLLTQNAKAFGAMDGQCSYLGMDGSMCAAGQCSYRGMDGSMCAAGVLIPDDLYHIDLEYRSVMQLPVVTALIAAGVVPEGELVSLNFSRDGVFTGSMEDLAEAGQAPTLRFLRELQQIHDSHEVDEWPFELRALAISHDLTMPEGV